MNCGGRHPGGLELGAGDAGWTRRRGVVCAVQSADCLPILLCDRAGSLVAAVHGGWRGLAAGIVERVLVGLGVAPGDLLAWLGPAICGRCYEVGDEVRAAFVSHNPDAVAAFRPSPHAGRWMADIYLLARQRLQAAGVAQIYGGGLCTVSDAGRFFSYRRDGQTGRLASVIWKSGEA